jgi:hypothetical protein
MGRPPSARPGSIPGPSAKALTGRDVWLSLTRGTSPALPMRAGLGKLDLAVPARVSLPSIPVR